MYFFIDEMEHDNYEIRESCFALMQGKRLGRWESPSEPPEPTYVRIINDAIRDVSIVNTTPNEGIGAPLPFNAGGKVTVELSPTSGCTPEEDGEWDSDVEVRNALAVLWEPDRDLFWVYGNFFTVTWMEFGETEEKSITFWDYMQPDGKTPKPLAQIRNSDPGLLSEMLEAGASLTTRGDAILFILSTDLEKMPRSIVIEVKFAPTIAVRNVTDGYVGGTVMVNDVGTASNRADGVPAYGGRPYANSSVYGKPDPGYRVDWSYILIRNLNDLDDELGEPVMVVPDADGKFTTMIKTEIAGKPYFVEKSGRVYEGSIVVEIYDLPVSLQIDLRFIPEGTGGRPGDTEGNSRWTQGDGLPRTGVESVISTLVIGLIVSITAGAAVMLVIWRINAKEKKYKT